MKKVHFEDLGLIDFQAAWDFQTERFNEIVQRKLDNRNLPQSEQKTQEHWLIRCSIWMIFLPILAVISVIWRKWSSEHWPNIRLNPVE